MSKVEIRTLNGAYFKDVQAREDIQNLNDNIKNLAPVTSVNGKTGAVSLSAGDVGADATGTATNAIALHNVSAEAHADIREILSALATELAAIGSQEAIVQQVIEAIGTPVFGRIEDGNNITLTANNLADGIYTFRFEKENGGLVEIGVMEYGNEGVEVGTFDIPFEWEMGIKLSKTDNTWETVSTDHTTATSCYGASPHIPVEEGAVYTVGMRNINWEGLSVCCFDADGNLIAYLPDVVHGPQKSDAERVSVQSIIDLPDGTATFRLRLYIAINAQNSVAATMSRFETWLTKTISGAQEPTYTNLLNTYLVARDKRFSSSAGAPSWSKDCVGAILVAIPFADIMEKTLRIKSPNIAGKTKDGQGTAFNSVSGAGSYHGYVFNQGEGTLDYASCAVNEGNGTYSFLFTDSNVTCVYHSESTMYATIVVNTTGTAVTDEELAQVIITIDEPIVEGSNPDSGMGSSGITNLADPTSADWLSGYRITNAGEISAESVTHVTNYIPVKAGDVVRVRGQNLYFHGSGSGYATQTFYNANKERIATIIPANYISLFGVPGNSMAEPPNDFKYTVATSATYISGDESQIAYVRFTGRLWTGYTKEDVIITVNEEIPN